MKNEILLLYNLRENFPTEENIHPDISADWDIPETIDLLYKCMTEMGLQVTKQSYEPNNTPSQLLNYDGIVFSICEMTGGSFREALIPSFCELVNLTYVFSSPEVMLNTLDKNSCNFLVKQMGLNVPDWTYLTELAQLKRSDFQDYPYLVKLSHEGSGIGISNASVVYNAEMLDARVREMFALFDRPILIQKYIEGTEVTIGVVGPSEAPEPLGVIEVLLGEDLVYGILQKENAQEKVSFQPYAKEAIAAKVKRHSEIIYKKLGCRDAARLDFRIDKNTNEPYFIEINPLPHLHPVIGDFCRSAYAAGYTYPALINTILKRSLTLKLNQSSNA